MKKTKNVLGYAFMVTLDQYQFVFFMNVNILGYLLNAITLLLYSQIWNTFFQFCDTLFVFISLSLFITSQLCLPLTLFISSHLIMVLMILGMYVFISSLFSFPLFYFPFSLSPLFYLFPLHLSIISPSFLSLLMSMLALSLSLPSAMPHLNLLSSSPSSQFLFYFILFYFDAQPPPNFLDWFP